jgi:small-conductance mechanosensitive channel
MNWSIADTPDLWWKLLLIVGYPLCAIALLEIDRGLRSARPLLSSILRQVAYILLPTAAVWMILRVLAGVPAEDVAVRLAKTLFAVSALYLLLRTAQAILTALLDEQMQAPKLLLDLLRIGLSLLCGAAIVSDIWHVNLASLVAAMGVGSIILGFALQDFLGNLLSGLSLLSAHKFGIGDWIVVNAQPLRVLEMDWRTVTLVNAGGARTVVANSSLAKGNLVIAARADQPAWADVVLTIGVDVPPEEVKRAALEAAGAEAATTGLVVAKCLVTEIGLQSVKYLVQLPVANPGILSQPRDEFLSRFWYIAQRNRIRLGDADSAALDPDEHARLRMLEQNGALLRGAEVLPQLARAAEFRRYRRGDVILGQGDPATDVLLVISGALAAYVTKGQDDVRLELVGQGQLLAMQEMLVQGASPARIVAEADADVLAIPSQALVAAFETARVLARDIGALTEARRQAILALRRGIRDAA